MKVQINHTVVQVIILDISGIYAQIHNQGYFDKEVINDINDQYKDCSKWKVIVIE